VPEANGLAPRSAPGSPGHERGEAPLRPRSLKALVKRLPRRSRIEVVGGAHLTVLVLACTYEDVTAIDLSSGALVRLRVSWPDDHLPDLASFDVVEAELAVDPERDDLAQPEAATLAGLPRRIGSLRGRSVRHLLHAVVAPPSPHLLGFPGPSAPYWEFRGAQPSVALIVPNHGPQLLVRPADGSVLVRFGWQREDVWLPVVDVRAVRAISTARRERLAGKQLSTALGFRPYYLLTALSAPIDGHCYKLCTAILPHG
jgi:hypothetical protein